MPKAKPPEATDEQLERVGVELRARMADLELTRPMLAVRAGLRAQYLTPLVGGKRPDRPVGDITLTKVAEVLGVRPQVLIARVRGTSDEPLTAAVPVPVGVEGPATRIAALASRLDDADAVMVERLILRLLGD